MRSAQYCVDRTTERLDTDTDTPMISHTSHTFTQLEQEVIQMLCEACRIFYPEGGVSGGGGSGRGGEGGDGGDGDSTLGLRLFVLVLLAISRGYTETER